MNRPDQPVPSTRPYLIRALYDWCADNGFSPYLAVHVDGSVQVPMEFVRNNEIVLNVSADATNGLRLGNETIEFKARFGGVARDIVVPVTHVIAIYARENGQGMAFPAPASLPAAGRAGDEPAPGEGRAPLRAVTPSPLSDPESPPAAEPDPGDDGPDRPGGRPHLKRIK